MNSWEVRNGNKPIPNGVKRKLAYAGQYYLPEHILDDITDEDGNAEMADLIDAVDNFGEWL